MGEQWEPPPPPTPAPTPRTSLPIPRAVVINRRRLTTGFYQSTSTANARRVAPNNWYTGCGRQCAVGLEGQTVSRLQGFRVTERAVAGPPCGLRALAGDNSNRIELQADLLRPTGGINAPVPQILEKNSEKNFQKISVSTAYLPPTQPGDGVSTM